MWFGSSKCNLNPTNCQLATDITGICTQAAVGYYLDVSSVVRSCLSDIPGCGVCISVSGTPSCTSCLSGGSLTGSSPNSCDCPGMDWYDARGTCQPAITNCVLKNNIDGCVACEGAGTLSGTVPQVCNPPNCSGMMYSDSGLNCQAAILNCSVKANITGCSQCKGQGTLSGSAPVTCNPPVCNPGENFGDDWICRLPISAEPLTFVVVQSFSPQLLSRSDIAF